MCRKRRVIIDASKLAAQFGILGQMWGNYGKAHDTKAMIPIVLCDHLSRMHQILPRERAFDDDHGECGECRVAQKVEEYGSHRQNL
jgi:monomeric isocitrate dehydrogenase